LTAFLGNKEQRCCQPEACKNEYEKNDKQQHYLPADHLYQCGTVQTEQQHIDAVQCHPVKQG